MTNVVDDAVDLLDVDNAGKNALDVDDCLVVEVNEMLSGPN